MNNSGKKYLRRIFPAVKEGIPIVVDVYCVLEAFEVHSAPISHAIKKLLCPGKRDKGSEMNDLAEAKDCIERAIEILMIRENYKNSPVENEIIQSKSVK